MGTPGTSGFIQCGSLYIIGWRRLAVEVKDDHDDYAAL
jgi:hypothetical protein